MKLRTLVLSLILLLLSAPAWAQNSPYAQFHPAPPSISVDLSLIPDHGVVVTASEVGVAAENLSLFDVCYKNAAGKWAKADATTAATAGAKVMAIGVVLQDATSEFMRTGYARDDSWAWDFTTNGGLLYLDKTAPGKMVQSLVGWGSGNILKILGTARTATVIEFFPNSMNAEHL
jgi:hypothetical protein